MNGLIFHDYEKREAKKKFTSKLHFAGVILVNSALQRRTKGECFFAYSCDIVWCFRDDVFFPFSNKQKRKTTSHKET